MISRTIAAILLACAFSSSSLLAAPHLGLNDVSLLWPVPFSTADLSSIISMDALKGADGAPVWSDQQFADLLATVDSDVAKVDDTQVSFPAGFRSKSAWKIAAIRIDPTAPGGHSSIASKFGRNPQIRLIIQPVITNGSRVKVHDAAVHLVYSYLKGGPGRPDFDTFREIIADLDRLKQISESAGAITSGRPLGFHPALRARVPGFHAEVTKFLSKYLSNQRLTAMALMGIPEPFPEPWIFVALRRNSTTGSMEPIPTMPAQMIDFRGSPSISPTPVVNNRPVADPDSTDLRGVSTAPLFNFRTARDDFAVIANTPAGEVRDTEVRNRDIADVIGNPILAHFLNTDCVSCHTETRRRDRLLLPLGPFAFRVNGQSPLIAPEVFPRDDWNVRNFGWFTPFPGLGGGPTVGTVTQRTANETAEVVEFIERNFRGELSE